MKYCIFFTCKKIVRWVVRASLSRIFLADNHLSPSKSQNKIVANESPLNIHWIKTLFDNSFSYTCSLKIHSKSDYLDVQYVIFLFDIFLYNCFLINFLKKGHYIILFPKLPWYTVTYVYKSVWYLSKTINKWKMN